MFISWNSVTPLVGQSFHTQCMVPWSPVSSMLQEIGELLPFCLIQTPSIQLHIHLTLQTMSFILRFTILSMIGINKNTHHQSMPWINLWASPLLPNTDTFHSAPYSPNPPNWHLSFYGLQFSLQLASIRTPIINPCHGSILPYTVYGFMFTRPTSHFPSTLHFRKFVSLTLPFLPNMDTFHSYSLDPPTLQTIFWRVYVPQRLTSNTIGTFCMRIF